MKDDQTEWREGVYADCVSDAEVEKQAWRLAGEMASEDDPVIHRQDVVAARPYLRTCLMRMADEELRSLSPYTVASLWARGALGSARYRVGAVEPRSPKRGRRPP